MDRKRCVSVTLSTFGVVFIRFDYSLDGGGSHCGKGLIHYYEATFRPV